MILQKIESFLKRIVLILFGGIVFYLLFLSLFGTSVETPRSIVEARFFVGVYYLPDNPLKHMLLTIVFLFILFLIYNRVNNKNVDGFSKLIKVLSSSKFTAGLLLFVFILGISYVLSTQLQPSVDSYVLQTIADKMLLKDFSDFLAGGYMHRYPNNNGFLLLVYIMKYLFGSKEQLLMQGLNVIALVVIFWSISKIVQSIWKNDIKGSNLLGNITIIAQILFIPIFLYITFIYGNLISYSAAILAIYLITRYFDTYMLRYAFGAAVLMGLAVIWKSNSSIFLVAIILYALYQIIFHKSKLKTMAVIIIIVGSVFIGNKVVDISLASITNIPTSRGMPKSAWIAMGLEESMQAPGYYNGTSVNLYTEHNYDYDDTDKAAWDKIYNRVKVYIKDWRTGLNFFGRKVAAQWNEPTFNSITISKNRESDAGLPIWIKSIFEGKLSFYFHEMLNIFQSLILFGVSIFIILRWKYININELLLAGIIIGGFLFQLFWEGKSQYVLIYFFLFLPYSVIGYILLIRKLNKLYIHIKSNKSNLQISKKVIAKIALFLMLILAAVPFWGYLSKKAPIKYTIGVRSEKELLQEYKELKYDIIY